jgi:antiviral helicase SLH1
VHPFQTCQILLETSGIPRDETSDDPQLGTKRTELIVAAARKLADTRMINFDQDTNSFKITDLGRIAAKYYIRHASIEVFNEVFRSKMSEADVLGMLSMSTEVSLVIVLLCSLLIRSV